jgi:hypothetical protein
VVIEDSQPTNLGTTGGGAWYAVAREKPPTKAGWYLRVWVVCAKLTP